MPTAEGFYGQLGSDATEAELKAADRRIRDYWRIDLDEDVSRVSPRAIREYVSYAVAEETPNEILEIIKGRNSEEDTPMEEDPQPDPEEITPNPSRVNVWDNPNNRTKLLTSDEQLTVDTLIMGEGVGESFAEMLDRLINKLGWESRYSTTWSTIYAAAGINHEAAREIRNGNRLKFPNLYRLVIVMRLDYETAKELIEKAGLSLGNRTTWTDIVVSTALKNRIYNRRVINEALIRKGQEPLFPNLESRMKEAEAQQTYRRRFTDKPS